MDASVQPAASSAGPDPVAGLGAHVELDLLDETGVVESLALDIVPDAEADLECGLLGVGTPLAKAIAGQGAGATVNYRMGDVVAVRIRRVSAGRRAGASGAAAKRAEIVRRAVARAEMINDMSFALAAGSKWGDYDPGKLPEEPKPAARPREKKRETG